MISFITQIAISGKRESMIRMLNAALCNVESKNVITESDDLDVINHKLMADDGIGGIVIGIPDLLAAEFLEDKLLQEQKQKYEADSHDDECEYSGRSIEVVRVENSESGYTAMFLMDEYEDYRYCDWVNWSDIARLYDCRVIVDVDAFRNDGWYEFCGTTIYEVTDGSVKETHIVPRMEDEEYFEAFDKLCKLNPKRYKQKQIDDLEAKVSALQEKITREKLLFLLENLDETDGHLNVPEGVTHLSLVLLQYTDKLRSIYIPASVDTINKRAISSSNLESIEISPDNPNFCSVNNCILDKDKTRLLIGCRGSVIPEGVAEIEEYAFYGCRGLTSIVIPNSVTVIGNDAFGNCSGLEKMTIPSHVKTVDAEAFRGCTSLSELTIEDGVESLGCASFMGCTALTSVTLPETLTNLPKKVFEDCTSLTDVTLPKHLEDTADDAFKNTPWGGGVVVSAKTDDDLPF